MKKLLMSLILISVTVLGAGVFSTKVSAQDSSPPTATSSGCELNGSVLGIPTWYKYLNTEIDSSGRCSVILGESAPCPEDDPQGACTENKINSALPIGLALLEALLRFAGLVAVTMVFWGGFKYITAQGNPDNAKGARTTVINAIIGLVIVIISTSLINFIGGSIS